MIKKMGYRWNLRRIMADHDMYATTDLVGPLAERGVVLSREQVFRLVTQTPQRLSMDILAALCAPGSVMSSAVARPSPPGVLPA